MRDEEGLLLACPVPVASKNETGSSVRRTRAACPYPEFSVFLLCEYNAEPAGKYSGVRNAGFRKGKRSCRSYQLPDIRIEVCRKMGIGYCKE